MLASAPVFRMEMSDVVQIILGTNGSGKTSLVRDMSVLPGIKDHYAKGGYKKVIVHHNGDRYRLESHFDGHQEHYFYKNDIEDLNPGRTLTVQKEMVKKVFGVTPDIHELLVGDEVFTQMSPARRREWLTRLCDTDYTYSIGVFKKVMSQQRDAQGGLNILRARLADETAKRMSDETIADIRRRLTEFTVESQRLYALKNVDARDTSTINPVIEQAKQTVQRLDARFRQLRKEFINDTMWHPDELQDNLSDITTELAKIESAYATVSQDFMDTTDKLGTVQMAQGFSIPEIVNDIDELKAKKAMLLEQGCKNIAYDDPISAFAALEENYEMLVTVFGSLAADPAKEINKENYEKTQGLVDQITRSINQATVEIEKLEHKKEHYEHLKSNGAIACPSCNFSWIRDYDEDAHRRVVSDIGKLQDGLAQARKTLEEKQKLLKDMGTYVRCLDPYNQLARHNRAFRQISEFIAGADMVKMNPRGVLLFIESERIGLRAMQAIAGIDNAIREKISALELARKSKDSNAELLKEQLAVLEVRLGDLVNRKSEQLRAKESLEQYIKQVNSFYEIESNLNQCVERLERLMKEWFDATRNELIDQILVDTHTNIAQLRNSLNEIENRDAVLKELQEQIATLEVSEKALKEVGNALSPVDGLIAEGMLGFIRHYVDAMNALIEKVWSYQLVVKDCSLEEDTAELNYKFPMQVGNQIDPVPDVSKGSSGMTDIVNMAFKVVAMYKAGLSGYPLVLDEFGKAFDEEHREAAMRAIKEIIDSLGFSQIFMISHYESCWGAFDNAQICVLDKRNITLPAGLVYNQHVQMTA